MMMMMMMMKMMMATMMWIMMMISISGRNPPPPVNARSILGVRYYNSFINFILFQLNTLMPLKEYSSLHELSMLDEKVVGKLSRPISENDTTSYFSVKQR